MGRASARVVCLIGLTASIACYAPPEREEPPQLPAIELEPVAFPDEPEVQLPELEPGREYYVELLGELTLAPNAYGGRFVTPGGQELVLYSANAALLPFHGRRVRARGHVWTCDGERVFAPHDLSLVPEQTAYPGSELPPPPRVDSAGQLANLRSPWFRAVGVLEVGHFIEVGDVIRIERARLRLDDGTSIALSYRDQLLEFDPPRRVSLTLERDVGDLARVREGCVGDHERCGPPPRLGSSSR